MLGSLVWVGSGIATVTSSAALWFGGRSRYRRFTEADGASDAGALPGALSLLALTPFGVACGLGALCLALLPR